MISVFRIYLGRGWHENGRADDLRALFDALPEFLHTLVVLPPDAGGTEPVTPEARRAAVRVAMTQAHVAILWGGESKADDTWASHEVHIARTGFRGRIPVLAVVPPGVDTPDTFAVRAADRVEGWQATTIAYAVQEMAEAAAAERRELLRQLAAETEVSIPATLSPREMIVAVHPRKLPTAEIVEAFTNYRSARDRAPSA